MLFDIPKIKDKLIRNSYEGRMGDLTLPYSKARTTKIFEGDYNVMIDENNNKIQKSPFNKISVKLEISEEDLQNMTQEEALIKIDQSINQMALEQKKQIISKISESCSKVGNVKDMKGQRISAESLYDVLEDMDIIFDENGNPDISNYYINDIKFTDFVKKWPDFFTSSRYSEIMKNKEKLWHDRENSRKLVG